MNINKSENLFIKYDSDSKDLFEKLITKELLRHP